MTIEKNSLSWCSIKFTDVLDVQGGTQPPKSQFISEPRNGYIRLLQIRDFGKKPVPTFIPDTTKIKKCTKRDVLIGRYGASLGRICTGMEGAYNVALAKVLIPSGVAVEYVKYYLLSEEFQNPLRLLSRSAQNGFNKDDLSRFDFRLAPLAEQKQIVTKLDELLTQADTIKTHIDTIPNILKRFRQSVLAAAVNGKLTEEWRGKQKSFTCVKSELENSYKNQLANVSTDSQKNKLMGIYSANENPIDFPKNLPDTWLATNLAKLCEPFSYGTSSKSSSIGDVPVLRMGNIQNGKLNWDNLVYTSNKDEVDKYSLQDKDILFNRTNSPDLVGKTAIYRCERKSIYAGYLIRARCLNLLIPEFLNFLLNSPYGKNYCWQVKSDGVSQSNINAQKLGEFVVPLTSLDEQTEIVRRVEELFLFADQIEQRVKEAQTRVNNLTQSILAKAFRGELTADWREQNPDLISGENSAEALLEKIKKEREAIEKAKPKKKKPKNSTKKKCE